MYLSPIIDCFDGLVISWSIGTHPDAELVNTMLDAAIETVAGGDARPIVHSDRGAHYRWLGWLSRFDDAKLARSTSRTFEGAAGGEIAFGALKGFLDVRYGARDGAACADFSWQGYDDNDPACGRGWVIIGTAGRLVGHFFIHNADNSGFVCEPT